MTISFKASREITHADIKFQHEEDGFDDPSPNSVAELIKNNGIRFK